MGRTGIDGRGRGDCSQEHFLPHLVQEELQVKESLLHEKKWLMQLIQLGRKREHYLKMVWR